MLYVDLQRCCCIWTTGLMGDGGCFGLLLSRSPTSHPILCVFATCFYIFVCVTLLSPFTCYKLHATCLTYYKLHATHITQMILCILFVTCYALHDTLVMLYITSYISHLIYVTIFIQDEKITLNITCFI